LAPCFQRARRCDQWPPRGISRSALGFRNLTNYRLRLLGARTLHALVNALNYEMSVTVVRCRDGEAFCLTRLRNFGAFLSCRVKFFRRFGFRPMIISGTV
jgi:hypothetical protein